MKKYFKKHEFAYQSDQVRELNRRISGSQTQITQQQVRA